MVNKEAIEDFRLIHFINHLHGGECETLLSICFVVFINHLHGGEFTGVVGDITFGFINHLHGGEL